MKHRGAAWVSMLGLRVIAVSALVAFAGLPEDAAQAGPLIQNGSFEQTSNISSPGGYICGNGAGDTCISNLTDWTSTCAPGNACGGHGTPSSILYANTNGSAWNGNIGLAGTIANSPDGGNYIAIDADSAYRSSISQTVTGLTAGQSYVLTFYQAAAQQSGGSTATTEQWQVTFGSSVQTSALMNNKVGGFVPWQVVTLDFIATSSSQILTFLALGGPTGDPPVVLLDGVSLQVPEPGTLALLGGGVLAMLAARRRSRSVA